jgi:predicted nucleic acid-binding protein
MKLMFDTNVFNDILDGKIDLTEMPSEAEFFATHIQLDEINNTKDDLRRSQLRSVFHSIIEDETIPTESTVLGVSRLGKSKLSGKKIPTETIVWDVSRWDESKWSSGELYEKIKIELDKKNGGKTNNIQDALIAEASIFNGLILVTRDNDLGVVVKSLGGQHMDLVALNEPNI